MTANVQLLIARVFLALIFLVAGFGKISAVEGTAGYFASLGLPVPGLTVWLVIALEIVGGLAILFGGMTRTAAFALAAFCVASGYLAHFQPEDQMQMTSFMKNLAMAGGFLALAVSGPGAWSLDARRGAAVPRMA